MKKIYFIGGPMGVGKTTACKILKNKLSNCVFLDGDWCWDMNPFQVNEETKKMVIDNICYLLNNFLKCSSFDNIIFCWVMHQQSILDELLENIDLTHYKLINISLICDEKNLTERLKKDIAFGIRNSNIIENSISRIELYKKLNTILINTSDFTPEEVSNKILEIKF